jgi:hypothetical protein
MDVKWYVPQGDSSVFSVTKRKFHNVLQGVAKEGTKLEQEDKELFERWTEWNYERYWRGATPKGGRSPIDVDLIVIDDPQRTCRLVLWGWGVLKSRSDGSYPDHQEGQSAHEDHLPVAHRG